MRWLTAIALLLGLIGCASQGNLSEAKPCPEIVNTTVGQWENRYPNDPGLAGVSVQQYPDCPCLAQPYEGKHPAMIIYVFKNDWANQVCFQSDGSVEEDFWFRVEPDNYLWEKIDRSFAVPGSKASHS